MGNFDDYFAKMSEDIIIYIKEEKYDEALDLINSELEQPYIPNDHYMNLINTKNELESMLNEKKYNSEIDSLTKLQVWDKIYNFEKETIDEVYLNLFFVKFENEIDEVDFSIMQKIFLNKKLDNVQKTILISSLITNNVSHTFDYYNSYTKIETNIDFTNFDSKLGVEQSEILFKKLEDFFLKDPSKFQIAQALIQILLIQFFPNKINFLIEDIVSTIINIVKSLFGEEKIKDNKISEIIVKYIN